MEKLLLISSIILSFSWSSCQVTLSQKSIEERIDKIENLQNKKIYIDTSDILRFDTSRGHFKDTAVYNFTVDLSQNSLAKVNYVQFGENRHVSFYYNNDRLIAAKIVNDNEYPSRKGSMFYFKKPYKYNKDKLILTTPGAEMEEEVRERFLYEGYSDLDAFKRLKYHQ
jgi:hypothetical protein